MAFVLVDGLKFASLSEWLVKFFAIPAHFLAVPDWRNGLISSPTMVADATSKCFHTECINAWYHITKM